MGVCLSQKAEQLHTIAKLQVTTKLQGLVSVLYTKQLYGLQPYESFFFFLGRVGAFCLWAFLTSK